METKVCSSCGQEKPINDYQRRWDKRRNRHWVEGKCKKCVRKDRQAPYYFKTVENGVNTFTKYLSKNGISAKDGESVKLIMITRLMGLVSNGSITLAQAKYYFDNIGNRKTQYELCKYKLHKQ